MADRLAIQRLVDATYKSRSAVQLRRTLNFLRTKLKNEQITMRISGVDALVGRDSVCNSSFQGTNVLQRNTGGLRTTYDQMVELSFPAETGTEILDLYLSMVYFSLFLILLRCIARCT